VHSNLEVSLDNSKVFVASPVRLDPDIFTCLVVPKETAYLMQSLLRLKHRTSYLLCIRFIYFHLNDEVLERWMVVTLTPLARNKVDWHWQSTDRLVP
jgi:hypothetical protein